MTILALGFLVLAVQRELGAAVVKTCFFPSLHVVAVLALLAVQTLVLIAQFVA